MTNTEESNHVNEDPNHPVRMRHVNETWRPTSRNTCPEPGCDEPRGDGWGGTCDEHQSEQRV